MSRPSTALSEGSSKARSSVRHLPEVALLDFLLSSIYVQDLKQYYHRFGAIPDLDSYEGTHSRRLSVLLVVIVVAELSTTGPTIVQARGGQWVVIATAHHI